MLGVRTPRYNTEHFLKPRDLLTQLSALGEVGATQPVDLFSVLKYLPERIWGNWKTRVKLLRETIGSLHTPLVDKVIERRAKVGSLHIFLDDILNNEELKMTKNEIDIMCGNPLEGGTDTLATVILTPCQAMALYPEDLVEAHQEMESMFGEDEMPSFADREYLLFVTMITKELMRWQPPAPTAFPDAISKKDDEIDDRKIPQHSTVILNIWGINYDASRYPETEKLSPRRFEGLDELSSVYVNARDYENHENSDHFGYGAGRRICQGTHLAERALSVAAARMLWAFETEPKINEATG